MASITTDAAAERLRIARELHDIVAYSFATISVQAGVAAHVVAERPDQAAQALGVIQAISGEAARELRTVLGLMHDAAGARCGVASLPSLADRMTHAGLPTTLSVAGDRRPLSADVEETIYRIAREALTNALRHAGPARATITLTYGPQAVVLSVADDGRGGAATPGFGLAGMAARARSVGGTLDAGPRLGRGFGVRARLPIGRQS